MTNYELMAVLPLEEDKREAGRAKLVADLEAHGAVIEKTDDMGDRDLAYEVQKMRRARYMLFTLKVDGSALAVLDKVFRLNGDLLKYLFVKL